MINHPIKNELEFFGLMSDYYVAREMADQQVVDETVASLRDQLNLPYDLPEDQ